MLRLLALAGFAITLLGSPMALAQNASFYTVTYIEVGPILSKVAAATLRSYRDATRKDDGNMGVELLQRLDQASHFVVISAWVDQKAFETHGTKPHTKAMRDKIAEIDAAPADVRLHHALSVAPLKAGRGSPVAVTHVDVVPPQKDNGAAALKELAEASRQHSGNLQFDIWQQTNRPNHFTIVEAWSSRGAFNVHVMQKETRDFRAKLAPMSGALYDERLYQILR
jgi:quinol monooxygenase YgiN